MEWIESIEAPLHHIGFLALTAFVEQQQRYRQKNADLVGLRPADFADGRDDVEQNPYDCKAQQLLFGLSPEQSKKQDPQDRYIIPISRDRQ